MGRVCSQNEILTGKLIGKRTLGIPRHRWEDNIRMDIKKSDSVRGTGLIQVRIGIIKESYEYGIERLDPIRHGVSYYRMWRSFNTWCGGWEFYHYMGFLSIRN